MTRRNRWLIFGSILIVAVFFRCYQVTYPDSYTDEAILAFRAIGMIDYDTSRVQTTPWQWFETVPWWAHLSFHDHPLVFFVLQHTAFKLFGISLWAVRLPAILAGVASVWLIFLLGRRLFNETVGYIAAALLAVQSYHVWVSRVGIQDGVVVALILLTLVVLFKIQEQSRWWLLYGALFGLGIITKYTFLIVGALTIWWAVVYRYRFYKEKFFWWGVILLVVVSAPTWLYNLFLYRATGHFDFQISAALHQNVPEWTFRLGRELTGGLGDRVRNFWLALHYANSQSFNLLTFIAFVTAVWCAIKLRSKEWQWLVSATIIMSLWFLVIGSTYRFIVMILPFLVLAIAGVFGHLSAELSKPGRRLAWALLGIFLIGEIIFSVNTFFTSHPFGRATITYAKTSEELQNYGFNQLDEYLDRALAGKVSALYGQPDYPFLTNIVNEHIEAAKQKGAASYPVIIIYDKDINFVANLWLFQRRLIYEGWPFLPHTLFLEYTKDQKDEYYRAQGIEHFIYIAPATDLVLRDLGERVGSGTGFENYVKGKGVVPQVIHNRSGKEAFRVYEF